MIQVIEENDIARYVFPCCSSIADERIRIKTRQHGTWHARGRRKGDEDGRELFTYLREEKPMKICFHSPAWISPLVRHAEIAAAFLRGLKDSAEMHYYDNQIKAEAHIPYRQNRKEDTILALRDDRPEGLVPGGGVGPLDALPGTIGEAVREVVSFVQCPVALGACSALAVVSLIGQGLVDVRRVCKLYGPTGLYFLVLANSGERKTSVDGYFKKPIEDWEAEQAEAATPDLKGYEAEIHIWEAKSSGFLTAIKEGARKGKHTGSLEEKIANLEDSKPEPPKVPRLLFSDATPEALTFRLKHDWPVGGVLSSEAGIVFGGQPWAKNPP